MVEEGIMNNHAFGLPEGTVRGFLTIILTLAVIVICILGVIKDEGIMNILDKLMPMATFMLGLYINKSKKEEPK